ncbi:hypothetical protein EDF88_4648 [Buttiauxella sp. BIGb0552]|uniref:hypothetical protein n=1 Tax=Buttiauxella sp. BIGb0552 TaxID=2485120 RepID=UPI0010670BF2|nr:hypothetical protein [Buttiauxella sp. BIGb0552]TDX12050.1 hypothetical protein EDF88_4648 [Buttiauxella sp. BIGb0552]
MSKLISNIIKSFLAANEMNIEVVDLVTTDNSDGTISSVSFNADLSFAFLSQQADEYCNQYSTLPFEMPVEEILLPAVNRLAKARNGRVSLDAIRMPFKCNFGESSGEIDSFSMLDCPYNREILNYIYRSDVGTDAKGVHEKLTGLTSYIYRNLFAFFCSKVTFAISVHNKTCDDQKIRQHMQFDFDGEYVRYDGVEIKSFGYPLIVLQKLLAPDSISSREDGKWVIRNAERYLSGKLKTRRLFVEYNSIFYGLSDNKHENHSISEQEITSANGIKTFRKCFVKTLLVSGAHERYRMNMELEHAQRYNY